QPAGDALEVPYVRHRGGQLDVAHPLPAHLRPGDLHPAPLADDPLEADALVLTAVALPVPGRAEDLLAEQPVLFRLEGAVVDCFRLLDLAVRPLPDVLGGGQADTQLVEEVDVEHFVIQSLPAGARPRHPPPVATIGVKLPSYRPRRGLRPRHPPPVATIGVKLPSCGLSAVPTLVGGVSGSLPVGAHPHHSPPVATIPTSAVLVGGCRAPFRWGLTPTTPLRWRPSQPRLCWSGGVGLPSGGGSPPPLPSGGDHPTLARLCWSGVSGSLPVGAHPHHSPPVATIPTSLGCAGRGGVGG